MPATASLEHFNFMSENTQDEFPKTSSEKSNEEVQSIDEIPSLVNQPTEAEKPDPEAAPTDEITSQADQPVEALPTPEDALPPEAQGEANGGPLGCCLGTMIGLLLSLSLAIFSRAYASTLVNTLQGNYGLLGLIVRILMGILALAFAIFFGYVGWKLGKRFVREYEPSKRELQYNAKISAKNAKGVRKS
jgi:hypothetical protein